MWLQATVEVEDSWRPQMSSGLGAFGMTPLVLSGRNELILTVACEPWTIFRVNTLVYNSWFIQSTKGGD